MEFPSAQRLKSGNSRSLIFGVLMFGPGFVSVCYSLACHAGVKVSIPGSIH